MQLSFIHFNGYIIFQCAYIKTYLSVSCLWTFNLFPAFCLSLSRICMRVCAGPLHYWVISKGYIGILPSCSWKWINPLRLSPLLSNQVFTLANLNCNTTLKKVWCGAPFKVILTLICYNPNTSLVILFSLPVFFSSSLFFRRLWTQMSKRPGQTQLISPCYPFSSALKEVWSQDVGQRGYWGGTVRASGRTEIEGKVLSFKEEPK